MRRRNGRPRRVAGWPRAVARSAARRPAARSPRPAGSGRRPKHRTATHRRQPARRHRNVRDRAPAPRRPPRRGPRARRPARSPRPRQRPRPRTIVASSAPAAPRRSPTPMRRRRPQAPAVRRAVADRPGAQASDRRRTEASGSGTRGRDHGAATAGRSARPTRGARSTAVRGDQPSGLVGTPVVRSSPAIGAAIGAAIGPAVAGARPGIGRGGRTRIGARRVRHSIVARGPIRGAASVHFGPASSGPGRAGPPGTGRPTADQCATARWATDQCATARWATAVPGRPGAAQRADLPAAPPRVRGARQSIATTGHRATVPAATATPPADLTIVARPAASPVGALQPRARVDRSATGRHHAHPGPRPDGRRSGAIGGRGPSTETARPRASGGRLPFVPRPNGRPLPRRTCWRPTRS